MCALYTQRDIFATLIMNTHQRILSTLLITFYGAYTQADTPMHVPSCIEQKWHALSESTTIAQLKKLCPKGTPTDDKPSTYNKESVNTPVTNISKSNASKPKHTQPAQVDQTDTTESNESLILARVQRERKSSTARSTLTPHNRNYILPITYSSNINKSPYLNLIPQGEDNFKLDYMEAKFQLSLKTVLFNHLITKNDTVHFAFTGTSYWQVYNKEISSPFRETNYEPELFWSNLINWKPFNVDTTLLILGFNHQSNGQAGTLSRSWNRLYTNFIWEANDFVFSFKPWYRLPEKAKESPGDPKGDDNPNIENYLGNFEFTTAYRNANHEVTVMIRNNLKSTNRGAFQIDWTFPLLKNVRGYVQYFNGYGESLIDYDANTQRLGVGFLLTDLL